MDVKGSDFWSWTLSTTSAFSPEPVVSLETGIWRKFVEISLFLQKARAGIGLEKRTEICLA
jgi:hypothetical protein